MAHAGGRPLKFQDPVELDKKINEFFDHCDKEKLPYTITGLALWLDCDTETIQFYKDRDQFSGSVKRAYDRVKNFAEQRLYSSSGVVAGPIFALKNFGWSDKKELDHTTQGKAIKQVSVVNFIDTADEDETGSDENTEEGQGT